MALINKEVEDFSATAYLDYAFVPVTKDDLRDKWSVFFFYPADFTFVCPTELEDLQNHYEDFQKIGCEIYEISCDTVFVHKAWHDHSETVGKVEFPMIGDSTKDLTRQFDVLSPERDKAERGTFIIDPDCRIVCCEVNASNIGRNAEEILRKVQASQFVYEHGDQLCQAAWHPGDEPIIPGHDLISDI